MWTNFICKTDVGYQLPAGFASPVHMSPESPINSPK